MRFVEVVEGEEFALGREDAARLRVAAECLRIQLRPSFALLAERAGVFRLTNVIGTIDLGGGVLVRVSPKSSEDENWAEAVVSLLVGSEAVELAGDRQATLGGRRNDLLSVLAGIYLRRLTRAFRQEGPIVLMQHMASDLPYLHGKLDATLWARSALWRPHVFPVSRTEIVADNIFTQGLTQVAKTLANASQDQAIRSGLFALARDLGAGATTGKVLGPSIGNQVLPEQWGAYKPAWSIASAVLTKTSLFGPRGSHVGIGFALEAWPLLETLLERSLKSVVFVGGGRGRALSYSVQGSVQLLKPVGMFQRGFSPEPDGRVFEDGKVLATFEAKYSQFDGKAPAREHIYQALTTAAACGAQHAVLVYPGRFDPMAWRVSGFDGRPACLIAVGLDLFSLSLPSMRHSRGQMILDALERFGNGASGTESAGAAA